MFSYSMLINFRSRGPGSGLVVKSRATLTTTELSYSERLPDSEGQYPEIQSS